MKEFSFSSSDDVDKWLAVWRNWPEREVYAHPNYVSLFCKGTDEATALFFEAPNGGVLFPFIKRKLSDEEWYSSDVDAHDVISPYGYGGPFVWGDGKSYREEFWVNYAKWCEAEKVVSSFSRLSLFPEQIVQPLAGVNSPYSNVVRSLDLTEDELWFDYKHAIRKNVKRGLNSGLEFVVDSEGRELEAFLEIYYSTMKRVEAGSGYYFPKEFFERIMSDLPGSFSFFHVLLDGKIIATELVLISVDNIYSFLGGTDPEFSNLRPNNFLKHGIIKWAKASGKKRFVLGGGYQKDDGIFKYKLAMAPNGEVPFFLCKLVHDEVTYRGLLALRNEFESSRGVEWAPAKGFFPEYRA